MRTLIVLSLILSGLFMTSASSIAGEDYPNEPLLLERMALACPKAENLSKAGSHFFYHLADGADNVEVQECLDQAIYAHLEDPWPVNTTGTTEATSVAVKPDGTIVLK